MPPRMLPEPTPETRHFWEGCKDGKLLLQRCPDTGRAYFPPRPFSPYTGTRNVEVFEASGLKVYVDQSSLPYVKGAVVDYVESLQGAGFKVENPNVVAACGCGSSFRVAEEEEVSAL